MENLNKYINEIFPIGTPVVFLHAHPDDESFLTGGLINFLALSGRDCIIVYTAASIVKGEINTRIRQKESRSAGGVLGVKKILFLPYCEPQYKGEYANPFIKQKRADLLTALDKAISSYLKIPFILVSYDKNGGYGNNDHLLLHSLGKDYSKFYPEKIVRILEATINRDRMRRWLSYAQTKLPSKQLPQLSYWCKKFGLPEKELTFFFELDENILESKKSALEKHKSQIHKDEFPASLPMAEFRKIFGIEYFK